MWAFTCPGFSTARRDFYQISLARAPAGAVILSLLATCAETAVVRELTGFALACPVIRINPALMPPVPAIVLLKALSAAFPKCAPVTVLAVTPMYPTATLMCGPHNLSIHNVCLDLGSRSAIHVQRPGA